MSPFGIFKRKPEPYSKSAGTSVSSEYWQTEPPTALKIIQHDIGGPPSGVNSLATCSPSELVELLTKPVSLARTEPSAETNHASTRMRSVTNRCINKSASLGGIMLELMRQDCSHAEAEFWCRRLGFID